MIRPRVALLIGLILLASAGCTKVSQVTRVVLVTFDTTRADRIGCYGNADARTPYLDALAADGVLFENAVSQVPTTLPSHATMFTGRFPQDHGVRYNVFYSLAKSANTLAESLQGAGFATAGFPASQVVSSKHGLDQGFDLYVDPPAQGEAMPGHGGSRTAGEGVDLALDWLAKNSEKKSFTWLHFYDPHWPYNPPFPFSSQFRDRQYDGEIAYSDAQLGRLIETLKSDAQWDDTLIIVAGDHGEGLYEHDERWHTMLVYESTQHVPLIVRAPGATSGRVSQPVTLADLMPTVLDLTGVGGPERMRGRSWRPALEGKPLGPRDVYFETLAGSLIYGWQELSGLRDGRWKLIDSLEPELFDLETDPGETNNLAGLEKERLSELRAVLEQMKESIDGEDADTNSAEIQLDPETRAELESLGYSGGGGGSAAGAAHPKDLIFLEPELLDAQHSVAAKDWKAVEELCRYTLERDGFNKWALIHMAKALNRLERVDDAIRHADIFIGLYPESPMGYDEKSNIQMERKQIADAFETLSEALEQPDLSSAELLRYKWLVAGFDLGAADICDVKVPQAIKTHANSGRMQVLDARCRVRDGDSDAALAALKRATEAGFGRIAELAQTDDFAELSKHPDFSALVEKREGDEPPVTSQ